MNSPRVYSISPGRVSVILRCRGGRTLSFAMSSKDTLGGLPIRSSSRRTAGITSPAALLAAPAPALVPLTIFGICFATLIAGPTSPTPGRTVWGLTTSDARSAKPTVNIGLLVPPSRTYGSVIPRSPRRVSPTPLRKPDTPRYPVFSSPISNCLLYSRAASNASVMDIPLSRASLNAISNGVLPPTCSA